MTSPETAPAQHSQAPARAGTTGATGWQRFWNRGRWWKALLAAVVYLALCGAFSMLVVGPLWGSEISPQIFSTPQSVFFDLFVPLFFGTIVLLLFLATLDWFPALFGRQPIRGRGWMWIAVVIIVIPIALRFAGIDYSDYDASVIALTFASGLLIGATEEILTRGIAVKILRDAGHREIVVAVISSALFALLHATNILSGQPLVTVLATIGMAFGFGLMMYLVLRVTGNLIWPILLHGLTDPTEFLVSGGIDVAHGHASVLVGLAGPFNLVFVVVGLIALFFIRGRLEPGGLGPAVPVYGKA